MNRTRIFIAVGLAVCALAVVAGIGALVNSSHDEDANSASSVAGGQAAMQGVADAAPVKGAAASAGGPPTSAGRSIIVTGSAHVVTDTPLDTADEFTTWVASNRGYVAGQTETGTGASATLTLTVRVPDQESAITRLRALGTVDQVRTDAQDVTTQATDLDARIAEARISIKRLETILAHTTTVRDVLTAESALTSRQQQLETMVLQRGNLSRQVALATLTVTFTGPAPAAVVAHRANWFHRDVTGSLHAFGVGVKAVVTAVAFLLPWALLAGLIALGWAGAVRWRRRLSH